MTMTGDHSELEWASVSAGVVEAAEAAEVVVVVAADKKRRRQQSTALPALA
jgi:hypothetical protein